MFNKGTLIFNAKLNFGVLKSLIDTNMKDKRPIMHPNNIDPRISFVNNFFFNCIGNFYSFSFSC